MTTTSTTPTSTICTRIPTPLGDMWASATGRALVRLEFADPDDGLALPPAPTGGNAITRQALDELGEYFEGRRTEFGVPLELRGTPFQREAWEALRRIPFGETRSYLEQATSIGRPRAVRAVAQANGANRIAVIIPCHRVIGADGSLTGYGAGVWRKARLLELEG